MNRYFSHLNTAVSILKAYKGEKPFIHFLKAFFKQEKKYGSKDRKNISHLCYSYFRSGKSLQKIDLERRVIYSLFLVSTEPGMVLETLHPQLNLFYNNSSDVSLSARIEHLQKICSEFEPTQIFPFSQSLSEGINADEFTISHLVQPELFLRIRPGKKETVTNALGRNGISFSLSGDNTIVLPNGTNIDESIHPDADAVIQDLNSQQTASLFHHIKVDHPPVSIWDCCAASGGKSIMAYDYFKSARLTVSDKRQSILTNLQLRFKNAGIPINRIFCTDLATEKQSKGEYDLVIADLPCSGSGTWGRAPENLLYFDEEQVAEYASLQNKILHNVVHSIRPGGYLLYITCSVFKMENEMNRDDIAKLSDMRLIESKVLKGYNHKADTMFAALFQLEKTT